MSDSIKSIYICLQSQTYRRWQWGSVKGLFLLGACLQMKSTFHGLNRGWVLPMTLCTRVMNPPSLRVIREPPASQGQGPCLIQYPWILSTQERHWHVASARLADAWPGWHSRVCSEAMGWYLLPWPSITYKSPTLQVHVQGRQKKKRETQDGGGAELSTHSQRGWGSRWRPRNGHHTYGSTSSRGSCIPTPQLMSPPHTCQLNQLLLPCSCAPPWPSQSPQRFLPWLSWWMLCVWRAGPRAQSL